MRDLCHPLNSCGAQVWSISPSEGQQTSQVIYLHIGPVQGPLVVFRVHNDGPHKVSVSLFPQALLPVGGTEVAVIESGTDCDISGSGLEFGAGIQLSCPNFRREIGTASGTYELMYCQPSPPRKLER
jgi:hypothetical protein